MSRRTLVRVAVVWLGGGWVANAVWEIAQSPLYEGHADWSSHLACCLRASVVDVGILAVLYAAMSVATRELDWWRRFSVRRGLLLAGSGLAIAVAIEMRALAEGRWAYAAGMPLVPGLGVGWSPLLQMVIIPVGLAMLSRWFAHRAGRDDRE